MNKGELEADQAEKDAEKLRDVIATIEGMTDVSFCTVYMQVSIVS